MARRRYSTLEPEEIFLDAQNLPEFNRSALEGRIERPLSPNAFRGLLAATGLLAVIFAGQSAWLAVAQHEYFATWAEENRLSHQPILAERGLILDRNGEELAANERATLEGPPERAYPLGMAAAHLIGYVSYPKRDQNGFWYQTSTSGVAGVEKRFDEQLMGENGIEIVERDASGSVMSGSVVRAPRPGENVTLSIDADIQRQLYERIRDRVDAAYVGGAGVVMDIETGELLALTSYPSYDPSIMSSGEPRQDVQRYLADRRSPFLDRSVSGVYAPGSIVKPFLAAAALAEGVLTPEKSFVSTGKLVVPNPFDPSKPSVFRDWRAHGEVDMRRAIAVSSDVYFYILGGGFGAQRGMGIAAINEYAARFGFGMSTGFDDAEPVGIVPSPEWKAQTFDESIWRVGDTYNTSIGQYGWQVTLLQSVRATAALANGGYLVTPTLLHGTPPVRRHIGMDERYLAVAREGMRDAVTDGTAGALAVPAFKVAGKTGTAEVGVRKEFMNSLIIGFFPYDKPRYAFAVILERAPAGTAVGAAAVAGELLRWIAAERPDLYTH